MGDCIFCKIAKEEILTKKIYENENFFSIPDANPLTKGHSLVISKKHFQNFLDLPNTLASECFDCVKKTTEILLSDKSIEGFNIVSNNFEVAGQVVNHVHFHILPRRKSDGLKIFS